MTNGSVLAQLTADVMAEKKTAAAGSRKLTPVAGEVVSSSPLDRAAAPFPNDHPKEVIVASVAVIRRELGHIEEALAAVEAELNVEPPAVAVTVADVKAQEKAADEKAADPAFADRFTKLKADAEAATYAKDDNIDSEGEPDESPALLVPVGWRCPTHHKAVTKTSEKTGRSFVGCPDCNLFER